MLNELITMAENIKDIVKNANGAEELVNYCNEFVETAVKCDLEIKENIDSLKQEIKRLQDLDASNQDLIDSYVTELNNMNPNPDKDSYENRISELESELAIANQKLSENNNAENSQSNMSVEDIIEIVNKHNKDTVVQSEIFASLKTLEVTANKVINAISNNTKTLQGTQGILKSCVSTLEDVHSDTKSLVDITKVYDKHFNDYLETSSAIDDKIEDLKPGITSLNDEIADIKENVIPTVKNELDTKISEVSDTATDCRDTLTRIKKFFSK